MSAMIRSILRGIQSVLCTYDMHVSAVVGDAKDILHPSSSSHSFLQFTLVSDIIISAVGTWDRTIVRRARTNTKQALEEYPAISDPIGSDPSHPGHASFWPNDEK